MPPATPPDAARGVARRGPRGATRHVVEPVLLGLDEGEAAGDQRAHHRGAGIALLGVRQAQLLGKAVQTIDKFAR